ncbi:MAG TPA: ACP S-malonyltransferase [Chitinophagales bacterium]|nr:ACP S-malonyltransferase [Chitinophagales bacterium]
MKSYLFPGQGSQFTGMAKDIYEQHAVVRELMEQANRLLGYRITEIMFNGPEQKLKETEITQPAIFLHSVALVKLAGESFKPGMVAGHSLGEFSALVASGTLSFEDGLILVRQRAKAMQEACDAVPSTMAAVIGLDDETVEKICAEFNDVVPANYNCPGQLVISGSVEGVARAGERLKAAGARMVAPLKVAGAFHSPFMEPARKKLEDAILHVTFSQSLCPVYQNVDALPHTSADEIRRNLIRQLTAPVLWTQTIRNMIHDGATSFTEMGPGKVLSGLVKKVDKAVEVV